MPYQLCRNGSRRSLQSEKVPCQVAKCQFSAAFLHFLLRCAGTLFIVSRVRGPGSGLHEGSKKR